MGTLEWYIGSLWGLCGSECGFGVGPGGEAGLSGIAVISCVSYEGGLCGPGCGGVGVSAVFIDVCAKAGEVA